MGEEPKNVMKGCIRTTKGPWLVHRATKGGDVVTKYRFPSDQERQKNKQRERSRRSVTRKIFAGLKAHGNYNLPKHADSNDLLKALCEEAGWHVDEDGTVSRKPFLKMPSLIDVDSHEDAEFEDEEFCTCGDDVDLKCQGELEIDLTLYLSSSFSS